MSVGCFRDGRNFFGVGPPSATTKSAVDFPNDIGYKLGAWSEPDPGQNSALLPARDAQVTEHTMKFRCSSAWGIFLLLAGSLPLFGQTITDFIPTVGTTNDTVIIDVSGFPGSGAVVVKFNG